MTQNPYAAPAASLETAEAPPAEVLYARLGLRFRAFLIDYFIVVGTFLLSAFVGGKLQDVPGAGALLFVSWAVFAVLYEPVMVWRTGGTIGHHLKNIHVVSERTGQRPGLFAAVVRNLIKMFLGWISFLLLLASSKQQAFHDAVVGVTVRIKDPSLARRRDYVRLG
jgi:uncharacterized RDD family membrane protein YckC